MTKKNHKKKFKHKNTKRVPITCTCGTHLESARAMQYHIGGAWHKIAKEARQLRKVGMTYSDIAFHFKGVVTSQQIWLQLHKEGF